MSPHSAHPSGHEARSVKTRSQLIEAAIEVIGAVGYEGASTRALAKTARTTLSAIPYHFGGKKELYLAAADMIADYADGRFHEALAVLDAEAIPDKTIRLEQAFSNFLQIMLENAEPHSWTSFVARCAYDNDEAFAVIHDRAIAPMIERLVRSAAEISGRSSDDEALRLRISAMVTAIVGFRFLRGIMLRGMGWTQIQPDGIGQIEDMVRDLCRSDFLRVHRTQ
ncbi:CerR family C-terminal domain-containing protein [Azospirillum rugosum]|uniref:AcrR family transcriptional regulator n=1 Tax=Azospirillum rugosum TaxID=416170 RepID=A0ABS4SXH6_9PROT|nr:CerR family C-terminal domain-containing protein [Azospirillum rugosum]MBP2297246.1 AcrR family transcriptional regulator [Azospirillum rugosum]MDQ0531088.1 AcrR family transcriptional regulator [Azospirillum rugosum]